MKSYTTSPDPEQPRQGFLTFLQEELARRCLENPQYSLRAFAGKIRIDHSTLSQLLRGRRALTERTIRHIAAKLDLANSTVEDFVALHTAQADTPREREVRRLTRDMIRVVSDWHHFAILELTHLRDFVPDSRWVARALDLTVDEVNAAVSRLLSLRLLEMAKPDEWIDRSGDTTASLQDFTEAAMRQWSARLEERSLSALDRIPEAWRDLSSTTLAIDSRRLPEVKRRIERFQRELVEFLDRDTERDEVFQLDILLSPLTNPERDA